MIRVLPADFDDPRLAAFLQAHLDHLAPTAPPESRHALDLSALARPGVRLWIADDGAASVSTANDDGAAIVGTVALAAISDGHEELKSMRTSPARRGEGIGSLLLTHALTNARSRGVTRVSLETGSMDFFAPARALYARAGFTECAPFGSYREDPNSVFFTLEL